MFICTCQLINIVETHGITIIEGMMSKTPQVLTRSGYSSQSARNEENCLVVKFKDSKTISSSIIRLMNDKELRARLGEQAKKDAVKDFSIHTKAEKHIDLYKEMSN